MVLEEAEQRKQQSTRKVDAWDFNVCSEMRPLVVEQWQTLKRMNQMKNYKPVLAQMRRS